MNLAAVPGAFDVAPRPLVSSIGSIDTMGTGGVKVFTFSVTQGASVNLSIGELPGSTNFYPGFRLLSPTGGLLGEVWDFQAATVNVTAPAAGVYTVVARDYGNVGGTGKIQLTLVRVP